MVNIRFTFSMEELKRKAKVSGDWKNARSVNSLEFQVALANPSLTPICATFHPDDGKTSYCFPLWKNKKRNSTWAANGKKYNCNLMQVQNVLWSAEKAKEQWNYNKNELFFECSINTQNKQEYRLNWIFRPRGLLHSQIRMVSLLWIHRWPWHIVSCWVLGQCAIPSHLKTKLLSVTHKYP